MNPLNFRSFDPRHVVLIKEGVNIIKPFEPQFTGNLCMREFCFLIQAMEMFNKDLDCGLNVDDFASGTTLFAFNLAADLALCGHAQPLREVGLNLELKFGTATTGLINVVLFALFDSKLEITKDRKVLMDCKS